VFVRVLARACVCTCVRAEGESKAHVAKLEEMGYNVFFSPQPPVNRPQANKQERGRGAGGERAGEYAAVTVRVQEEEALVFQQAHILSSTGECATT
jgi:hypothetical protein